MQGTFVERTVGVFNKSRRSGARSLSVFVAANDTRAAEGRVQAVSLGHGGFQNGRPQHNPP